MENLLDIKDLTVQAGDKTIIHSLSLSIPQGKVHAIMGPNGSGKSTLANVLMGHPDYEVTSGDILFQGSSILSLSPDERAKQGIFLIFQYPVALPGIPLAQLIRKSTHAILGPQGYPKTRDFFKALRNYTSQIQLSQGILERSTNDGYSGGEKKKAEALQMAMLQPKLVVVDEVDSGLDIDALRHVAKVMKVMQNDQRSFLVITHYQRILNLVRPDRIHIMKEGKLVQSGGFDLVEQLEKMGYEELKEVS